MKQGHADRFSEILNEYGFEADPADLTNFEIRYNKYSDRFGISVTHPKFEYIDIMTVENA